MSFHRAGPALGNLIKIGFRADLFVELPAQAVGLGYDPRHIVDQPVPKGRLDEFLPRGGVGPLVGHGSASNLRA
ncbi:MAG: hypothetical protein AAGA28_00860 [Pseudomonadota bacterium]